MREFGLRVDTVATRHLHVHNEPGTQQILIDDQLSIPLLLRSALMRLEVRQATDRELLPPEEGGLERNYLSSSEEWDPRRYTDPPHCIRPVISGDTFASAHRVYYWCCSTPITCNASARLTD